MADDLIEATLRAAKRDLIGFIHKPILKELKLSPDGVSTEMFDGVENKGVNLAQPKQVAAAMKEQQALLSLSRSRAPHIYYTYLLHIFTTYIYYTYLLHIFTTHIY